MSNHLFETSSLGQHIESRMHIHDNVPLEDNLHMIAVILLVDCDFRAAVPKCLLFKRLKDAKVLRKAIASTHFRYTNGVLRIWQRLVNPSFSEALYC